MSVATDDDDAERILLPSLPAPGTEADRVQFRACVGIGIFMLVENEKEERTLATMLFTFDEAIELGGQIIGLANDYKGATPQTRVA